MDPLALKVIATVYDDRTYAVFRSVCIMIWALRSCCGSIIYDPPSAVINTFTFKNLGVIDATIDLLYRFDLSFVTRHAASRRKAI